MKKIPDEKAEQLEKSLQKCLDFAQGLEEQYGDECKMNQQTAQRINDILDAIGAFTINSLY